MNPPPYLTIDTLDRESLSVTDPARANSSTRQNTPICNPTLYLVVLCGYLIPSLACPLKHKHESIILVI